VPKKMNELGNPHGNKIRGFFYPVREKVDIQAELDALAAAEATHAEHRERELTD
jgi:hypothetical protein